MGWAGGSEMCANLVSGIKRRVKDEKLRASLYKLLIQEFEGQDCDTLHEVRDPGFRAVYDKMRSAEE